MVSVIVNNIGKKIEKLGRLVKQNTSCLETYQGTMEKTLASLEKHDTVMTLCYEEYLKSRKQKEIEQLLYLIRLRESIKTDCQNLKKDKDREHEETLNYLEIYLDDITEELEKQGVEIFTCEPDAEMEYDRETQKAIARVEADLPEYNMKVMEVYTDGYSWNDRVIKKMDVKVSVYKQEQKG